MLFKIRLIWDNNSNNMIFSCDGHFFSLSQMPAASSLRPWAAGRCVRPIKKMSIVLKKHVLLYYLLAKIPHYFIKIRLRQRKELCQYKINGIARRIYISIFEVCQIGSRRSTVSCFQEGWRRSFWRYCSSWDVPDIQNLTRCNLDMFPK